AYPLPTRLELDRTAARLAIESNPALRPVQPSTKVRGEIRCGPLCCARRPRQDAPPGERIALGCGEYGIRTPVLGDRLQVGLGPATLPDRPCRLPVVGPGRATVWLSPNIGYEQADPR